MDARGFDSGVPRTYARHPEFGAADWAMLAGAALLSAAALTAAVVTGLFQPIIG